MLNYHENRLYYRQERLKHGILAHSRVFPYGLAMVIGEILLCFGCSAVGYAGNYDAKAGRLGGNNGISTYRAVHAIIGEAENQGYQGMLAVACAIRNRGTLKGVYGEHAPRVKAHKYSQATEDMAIKAWAESAIHDITNGATHWENIKAYGKPYWVASMVEAYRVGDHVFYKVK